MCTASIVVVLFVQRLVPEIVIQFITAFTNYCFCSLTMVLVEGDYENLQLPDHFKDEFPDTITVAQTAAAWKHIVDYQKENKLTNI